MSNDRVILGVGKQQTQHWSIVVNLIDTTPPFYLAYENFIKYKNYKNLLVINRLYEFYASF